MRHQFETCALLFGKFDGALNKRMACPIFLITRNDSFGAYLDIALDIFHLVDVECDLALDDSRFLVTRVFFHRSSRFGSLGDRFGGAAADSLKAYHLEQVGSLLI